MNSWKNVFVVLIAFAMVFGFSVSAMADTQYLTVSNCDDPTGDPGTWSFDPEDLSLREACYPNEELVPEGDARYITFDIDWCGGEIELSSYIIPTEDTTIDGEGEDVTITNKGFWMSDVYKDEVLFINSQNITIKYLTIADVTVGYWDPTGFAVLIGNGANGITIEHITFDNSYYGDVLVGPYDDSGGLHNPPNDDINSEICWCRFSAKPNEHPGLTEDVASIHIIDYNYNVVGGYTNIHHNFFTSANDRGVYVGCEQKATVYNNYFYGWDDYAVYSVDESQVYSEKNCYRPTAGYWDGLIYADTVNGYTNSESDSLWCPLTYTSYGTYCSKSGINYPVINEYQPGSVFTPTIFPDNPTLALLLNIYNNAGDD